MRVNRPFVEPRFPKRIQGRVRIFCRPLPAADNARFASAAMAPISRSVPSPSPARRGRFSLDRIDNGAAGATSSDTRIRACNPSTEEVTEGVFA